MNETAIFFHFTLLPFSDSASSDSMTELHSISKKKKKNRSDSSKAVLLSFKTTAKGLVGDTVITQVMKYYNIFVLCVFRYSFCFLTRLAENIFMLTSI